MSTLVDTSVWIQHLRHDSPSLRQLLEQDLVVCHPLVIGELACGHLARRVEVLQSLQLLPDTPRLDFHEILTFVEGHRLFGQGLGWVDVHLLASAFLEQVTIWTLDKPLLRASQRLQCAFTPMS